MPIIQLWWLRFHILPLELNPTPGLVWSIADNTFIELESMKLLKNYLELDFIVLIIYLQLESIWIRPRSAESDGHYNTSLA